MQLKYEDVLAVKSAGLLPVFGYALVVALVIGLGVGGFIAWKWTAGAHALKENAELVAAANAWKGIAEEQRRAATAQAAAMKAATDRLNAISQAREDDRKAIQEFTVGLAAALDQVAAANPALRDLDLGADFLRHWNRANAGPSAAAPAAGATGQPGAGVPAAPAGDQQQGAGAAGPARQGSGAVPRLPQRARAADRNGAGVASHRMALVLRRGGEGRRETGRLYG